MHLASFITMGPYQGGLGFQAASWSRFLHLRRNEEKILTINQLMKRLWPLVNHCYLCKLREKSVNCILIHCGKAQILWHLLPLQSFLSASLIQKGGLLGWHISFIGKKHKKGRNNCSFMLFFQAFDKRGIAKLLRIWSRLIKLWKSLLSDLYLSRFLTSLIVGE